MPLLSRQSPCIGFCSTVYGDDVCRGCNRYFEEVVQWQTLPDSARDASLQRVHALVQRVVREYVQVVDETLLNERLQRHQVPLPDVDSVEARVLALLYAGSHLMQDLSAYGLAPTERAAGMQAQDIKMAMVQRRVELAQPEYAAWAAAFAADAVGD